MSEAGNVVVGVSGAVAYADIGSTVPTTISGTLDAAFDDVGYVGDGGVTQAMNADVTDIKAWQNGDVVRKVQTSHDLTYQFEMLETSDVTMEAYYGDQDAITGAQLAHKAWVLDVLDDDRNIRVVIPDGQVTERGDVVYNGSEAVRYPVTITAYPDGSGNKAYIYRGTDIS
jgi:hypothetical protein